MDAWTTRIIAAGLMGTLLSALFLSVLLPSTSGPLLGLAASIVAGLFGWFAESPVSHRSEEKHEEEHKEEHH